VLLLLLLVVVVVVVVRSGQVPSLSLPAATPPHCANQAVLP
jgi:hypothetical protein